MLYLFYGSDEKKARERLRATIASLMKKAPHANVERITEEGIEDFSFESLLATQSLFHNKRLIIFDHVVSKIQKELVGTLPAMATSEHIFFILESTLTKAVAEKLKKYAHSVEHHEAKAVKVQKKKDHFMLAHAFGGGRKKEAWVEFHRQLFQKGAPEAIHGMLFWKVKDMLLKGSQKDRKKEEVEHLVSLLAALPQETRRRGIEMEYALERFILEH